jgi:hypothetical protein
MMGTVTGRTSDARRSMFAWTYSPARSVDGTTRALLQQSKYRCEFHPDLQSIYLAEQKPIYGPGDVAPGRIYLFIILVAA